MNIAVIPARGGSKRIPKKNIKEFLGKPIIAYSIELALKSKLFDRVIVSTDSEEIADVAREYSAEVPFVRPKKLSDDVTGTVAVTRHALKWCLDNEDNIKYVCCIYATAPFLELNYLNNGYEILNREKKSFAFSVTSYPYPIQRALTISKGSVNMVLPENYMVRSQDLEECFHDAGQFYWGTTEAYLQELNMFTGISIPIVLPRYLVQDIDTLEDWNQAELMYKSLQVD